ncbi:MAG: PepSY-associated TM helix domain-containing protein [Acidovorax sp.]
MKPPVPPPAKAPGLRQTMSGLHIWAGLLAGWLLYAMFLTGTVSYFRDELSQWMRPEVPAQRHALPAADVAPRIVATLSALAPHSPQWSIALPDARNNAASAYWRKPGGKGFDDALFDPATGGRLEVRDTTGGDFFYRFHFNLHYMPPIWGRWIAGLAAMFMLVAIVSGVITHKKIFTDFFTFRWGKGQRSWLDAHTALSVFGLPFHFMITYSGLVTLMVMFMPWGMNTALPTPPQRATVTGEMRFFLPPGKPAGQAAPLHPVAPLVQAAEARWGVGEVGRVQISLPGDANARIALVRADSSPRANPQYLLFDGVSGALLRAKDASAPAAATQGVLYGLHLGRYADTAMRWLYFLVSLAGTAMVGTGLVLWTVKRRARLPDPERPHFGFRLVERLNIASIAGLSIAMAAFLWANRLPPPHMAQRGEWEIHGFFIAWALALAYALARPPKRAWVELLWLAAALLALLPVFNLLATGRGLPASIATGDWVFAGADLLLLALAALHAALAVRTARHQPRPMAEAAA